MVLLSLEVYPEWADLRFARMETPGAPPLARRVPRPDDWSIRIDDVQARVVDAVGRGDRTFSNGEVRLQPPPSPGGRVDVTVSLAPGQPALTATFVLPDPPRHAQEALDG